MRVWFASPKVGETPACQLLGIIQWMVSLWGERGNRSEALVSGELLSPSFYWFESPGPRPSCKPS